jgi:hypothetical protein
VTYTLLWLTCLPKPVVLPHISHRANRFTSLYPGHYDKQDSVGIGFTVLP